MHTLIADALSSACFFFTFVVLLRLCCDAFWSIRKSSYTEEYTGSADKYLSKSDSKKWFYVSWVNSCIYPLYLCYLVVKGAFNCDVPESHRLSNNTNGDNLFNNEYCLMTVTEFQMRSCALMFGLFTSDLFV